MIWIVIGIVVFIIGLIVGQGNVGCGFLALIAFILWRLGMLGAVVSWIFRVIGWIYRHGKALFYALKYENFDKGGEAMAVLSGKTGFILGGCLF